MTKLGNLRSYLNTELYGANIKETKQGFEVGIGYFGDKEYSDRYLISNGLINTLSGEERSIEEILDLLSRRTSCFVGGC